MAPGADAVGGGHDVDDAGGVRLRLLPACCGRSDAVGGRFDAVRGTGAPLLRAGPRFQRLQSARDALVADPAATQRRLVAATQRPLLRSRAQRVQEEAATASALIGYLLERGRPQRRTTSQYLLSCFFFSFQETDRLYYGNEAN